MEIRGRIINLLPLQSGQGKNGEWRKQDYILETLDQYPKKICFNLWGDKINQYPVAIGDEVIVHFDVESREFNGRWYTDVKGWKIDRADAQQQYSAPQQQPQQYVGAAAQPVAPAPTVDFTAQDDDLPF
ncbi:MAG: DUF3127 domain-containing protein [Bacteroidales bacterium]